MRSTSKLQDVEEHKPRKSTYPLHGCSENLVNKHTLLRRLISTLITNLKIGHRHLALGNPGEECMRT
eukprot:1144545-Pelagomonas_calceolata.AAC.13